MEAPDPLSARGDSTTGMAISAGSTLIALVASRALRRQLHMVRSVSADRFSVRRIVPLAFLCAGLACAQPNDADFAAARDAFRAGDSARLERIAPSLKGHLLEAYVD